jgi:hypothetical protein
MLFFVFKSDCYGRILIKELGHDQDECSRTLEVVGVSSASRFDCDAPCLCRSHYLVRLPPQERLMLMNGFVLPTKPRPETVMLPRGFYDTRILGHREA